MSLLDCVWEKGFSFSHPRNNMPVGQRGFIFGVKRQGAFKTLHRSGPPAKSGTGQGHVPERLNVCGVLAQDATEKLGRFLEVPLVQTLESFVKELCVRQIRIQMVCASTASYSDARQRLPWEFLAQALRLQGRRITDLSSSALWKGWLVALLDGGTVRLRPYQDIPRRFPPHGNQHQKRTYWCLMPVVVGFCRFTGAALDCAPGSRRLSEQALGCEIMLRALTPCLFMGERNFGVFRIAQAAAANKHQVAPRLTDVRAAKLLGTALRPADHALTWKPTRHDQVQPGLPADPIQGRLIVVQLARPGFRSQRLCLFTTLADVVQYPLAEMVRLYGLRWHIELNLRYVKAQMELAQLEAHSAAMAHKEWLAGLMAYNLIGSAMLCSALHKGIPPLTLAFWACRRPLELWLRDLGRSHASALASWKRTLGEISQCRLPQRREPRPNEPRAQRHLRESFPPLIESRAQARRKLQQPTGKS